MSIKNSSSGVILDFLTPGKQQAGFQLQIGRTSSLCMHTRKSITSVSDYAALYPWIPRDVSYNDGLIFSTHGRCLSTAFYGVGELLRVDIRARWCWPC